MIQGRHLAIDYGDKRTGLAISDASGVAISNLPALASNTTDFLQKLSQVIQDHNPAYIVIGRPQQTDGANSVLQPKIDALFNYLAAGFSSIQIFFWDERYTSKIAERIWIEKQGGKSSGQKKQQKKKAELDSMAAHVLLRSYFDSLL